ncbi:membrane-bound lytic murein transglycosylase MltF [Thalassotalea sp. 1_MG-2023]|uniref:membrane-bound lytic murein transglycosylase MltF n=1 Tax=Thalassotalea sp. 1_MG-2023 TaxID=3062680 RepID=UPI0026E38744|nr:membrane-bound lytic murein transglycosylase MltF [Thalassotalea sp. 1_MG-2023]MDO6426765.1 membrane-bound lytic murein transglycosylase MltF [Thalassotalea sp. 1_MG-2023]
MMNVVHFKYFRNIFLVWLLCLPFIFTLSGCQKKSEQSGLTKVAKQGYITVGTLYGLTSYYIGPEGETGFEYELAKKYADYLGVELKIVASYSLAELFALLDSGEVDFLAAGLTITDKRLQRYNFAPSYNQISQKLVFKQGNKRPRKLEDLTGKLIVTANSSHVENLQNIQQTFPALTWQETEELDSEEVLIRILNDEYDYTIIDSHTLAVSRRYYPEISIGFTLQASELIAWPIRKEGDDSILASMIEFFGDIHHNGTLLALDDKYFGHVEQFNYVDTRTFIKAVDAKLPKYRPLFEKYAQEIDWRLLAAISYQESHWNPRARSHTGVRGMMMLTLPTAKQMGIKSRIDAEQSIQGGAKYFQQMFDRMPDRIPHPDRLWFALASYNVGLGHLNDAREITRLQGGDPDRWVDVKQRLPLLKQKKYYKFTRYGYARGDEPVNYVENIRRYYDTLTWMDEKQQEAEQQLLLEALEQQELTNAAPNVSALEKHSPELPKDE